MALAGCGVRFDTAPPTPAPPSASEVARQDLAIALSSLATSAPEPLSDIADAQAESLGGVWQACPPGESAERCQALESAPALEEADTPEQRAALVQRARSDFDELIANAEPALAARAGAAAPILDAATGAEAPVWGEGLWTSDLSTLTTLHWTAWQLEGAAARGAPVAELAAQVRAATTAPYEAGLDAERPPAVMRTEDRAPSEILARSCRELAARLPVVAQEERGALVATLRALTLSYAQLGGQLPATWLD